MKNLKPTLCVASVAELTPDHLRASVPDLEAMAFDLDKTLVGQHEKTIPPPHMDRLASLGDAGLKLGIISNAAPQSRTDRVRRIADETGNLLGIEIVPVTSRMVGGKKKPLRPVFDEMTRLLDTENSRIGYAGDQLFKDIWGANRAGYGVSVLVAPYGDGDDPRVRLQRLVEALVRPTLGLPLLSRNFGSA